MNELKRVLTLIMKTKNQPVVFHILHSHLAHMFQKKKVMPIETQSVWEKIVIASVEDPKIMRSSLEVKLLQYLKGSREKTEDDVFRLKIALYYMDSRLLNSLNMFILFELMSQHYNVSPLTDMLIDSILTKSFLSKNFGIKTNKKLQSDAVVLFLRNNNNFSYKRLPLYIHFDIEPPLVFYDNRSGIVRFKVLEALGFYGNYAQKVAYFKNILPQTEEFLDLFKKFVCKDPEIFPDKKTEFTISNLKLVASCPIDDLKHRIKKAFNESKNKPEFKTYIIDFLNSMEA